MQTFIIVTLGRIEAQMCSIKSAWAGLVGPATGIRIADYKLGTKTIGFAEDFEFSDKIDPTNSYYSNQ